MDKICDFLLLVNLLKYTYRVDPKPHLSNLKLNCANPYISFKQPKSLASLCVHALSHYQDIPPLGRSPKDSKILF
jgi:hypothetical protein